MTFLLLSCTTKLWPNLQDDTIKLVLLKIKWKHSSIWKKRSYTNYSILCFSKATTQVKTRVPMDANVCLLSESCVCKTKVTVTWRSRVRSYEGQGHYHLYHFIQLVTIILRIQYKNIVICRISWHCSTNWKTAFM